MAKVRNEIKLVKKKVLDAYFAEVKEDITYETTPGKVKKYTAVSGDYLSKIAKKNGVTLAKLKKDNSLTSDDVAIGQKFDIKEPDVKTEKEKKVSFTKLKEATFGQEVFLIVKTENLAGVELGINVKQGDAKALVEKDKAISIQHDDKEVKLVKIKVGDYPKDTKVTNKDDFKDRAVVKVKLSPSTEATVKTYSKALNDATDKKTSLFLAVGPASGEGKDILFCDDKGEALEGATPNYYLNEKSKWLEFKNMEAPWMATAKEELGEKEISGAKANKQILAYFKASKFWGTDDSGGTNAWCGSFVAWVMKENDYTPPKDAFRAKEWKNFGKKITTPVYGAIGIKSRSGGGHVAFIVGKSKDGKHYYMLGGNQSDEVNITKYSKDVWTDFVVPKDYDTAGKTLPEYTKDSKKAGSES